MNRYLQVTTTLDSNETAEHLAKKLVEENLAACVQISGPVKSWYRWKGNIESSTEWVLAIKTRSDRFDRLAKRIDQLHPYDEPEIIATSIVDGSQSYLEWIDACLDEKEST